MLNGQIQDVTAAEEIAAGIQGVTGVSEEQTATVEKVAASTDALSGVAGELLLAIEKFSLGDTASGISR